MPNVNSAASAAGLAGFNALGAAEAEAELLACCACRAFARAVAARRPYPDLAGLTEAAGAAVRDLAWPDVQEALAAHPRIGEPPRDGGRAAPPPPAGTGESPRDGGRAARETSWSRQEQSGVDAAGRAVLDGLAEGNRAYEERFGHVYLVCATGMTAEEMLSRLRERLRNDDAAERDVVRAELARITRLRVAKLLGDAR